MSASEFVSVLGRGVTNADTVEVVLSVYGPKGGGRACESFSPEDALKLGRDLIAAACRLGQTDPAPAMLAALRLAEKHIASTCEETSEADLPDWFADLRTIRVAIAAATGDNCN